MSRNYNQDHFKVGGTPIRSRALARLSRKRFTTHDAWLRQQASGNRFAERETEQERGDFEGWDGETEARDLRPSVGVGGQRGQFQPEESTDARARAQLDGREGKEGSRATHRGETGKLERAAERAEAFSERLAKRLPGKWGERLLGTWRDNRRHFGIAATVILAPLALSRFIRRSRRQRS